MAAMLVLYEDLVGWSPVGCILPNLLTCGGLLLRMQNGFAGAHLTAGDDFSQMQDFLATVGSCLAAEVVNTGATVLGGSSSQYRLCTVAENL